jgi:hypothetical protein
MVSVQVILRCFGVRFQNMHFAGSDVIVKRNVDVEPSFILPSVTRGYITASSWNLFFALRRAKHDVLEVNSALTSAASTRTQPFHPAFVSAGEKRQRRDQAGKQQIPRSSKSCFMSRPIQLQQGTLT